jgi:hypothetical protein
MVTLGLNEFMTLVPVISSFTSSITKARITLEIKNPVHAKYHKNKVPMKISWFRVISSGV